MPAGCTSAVSRWNLDFAAGEWSQWRYTSLSESDVDFCFAPGTRMAPDRWWTGAGRNYDLHGRRYVCTLWTGVYSSGRQRDGGFSHGDPPGSWWKSGIEWRHPDRWMEEAGKTLGSGCAHVQRAAIGFPSVMGEWEESCPCPWRRGFWEDEPHLQCGWEEWNSLCSCGCHTQTDRRKRGFEGQIRRDGIASDVVCGQSSYSFCRTGWRQCRNTFSSAGEPDSVWASLAASDGNDRWA